MADLEASAGLDITEAQTAVADLAASTGSELTDAFTNAVAAFTDAMQSAVAGLDVGASLNLNTEDLTAAVSGLGDTLRTEFTGATDDLKTGLASAADEGATAFVGQLEAANALAAEDLASKMTEALDGAAASFADSLSAAGDAGLSNLTDSAGGLGQVTDQVNSLGDATQATGNKAAGAGVGFLSAKGAVDLLTGGANAAKGEVAGLGDAIGAGSSAMSTSVGVIGGVTAAYGVLFSAGLRAITAEDRLNVVFGEQAETLRRINVGGLSGDVEKLAVKVGSTAAPLELVTANLGQFLQAAGATQKGSADLGATFEALVLKAVALNPTLGDAGTASQKLFTALITGRDRALAPFGLGLDSASIKAEALKLGLISSINDALTPYAKVVAGITLASQKAGQSLGSDFAKGADQAANKAKAVRAELEQMAEKLGKPLVEPLIEFGQAAEKPLESIARIVAALLTGLLPVVQALETPLRVFATVLGGIADVMNFLSPVITGLVTGFLVFKTLTLAQAAASSLLSFATQQVTIDYALFGATVETVNAEIEASSIAADATNPLLAIAALAGAAAAALGIFGSSADTSSHDVDNFADAVTKANGALDDTADKAAVALFKQRHQLDDLAGAGLKMTDVLKAVSTATPKAIQVLEEFEVKAGLSGLSLKDTVAANKDLVESLGKTDPALQTVILALTKHGTINAGVVKTLIDLSAGYITATDAAKNLKQLGVDPATASLATQQASLQETEKALSDFVQTATQGLPSVSSAFDAAATSASNIAGGLATASKAFDDTTNAFDKFGVKLTATNLAQSLETQLFGVAAFSNDLKTLVDANLGGLAELLASKGADAAGQLTHQLAEGVRNGTPLAAVALNGLVAQFQDANDRLVAAISPEELEAQMTKDLQAMQSFTQNIATLVASGFDNIAHVLVEKGPAAGGGIAQTLVTDLQQGRPDLVAQLNNTAGDLTTAGQQYAQIVQTQWGPAILAQGTTAFQGIPQAAQAGVDAAGAIITTDLPGIASQVLPAGKEEAWAAFFTGLPQAATTATTAAGTAVQQGTGPGSPVQQAAGTAGAGTATAFGASLAPTLTSQIQFAMALAGNVFGQTSRFILNAAAQGAGYGAGLNFGLGLHNGIIAADELVKSAARKVVGDAEQAAKDKAGIKSPSTLFAAIGQELVAGLAVGIEAATPRAKAAMGATVEALTPAVPQARVPVAASSTPAGAPGAGASVVDQSIHVDKIEVAHPAPDLVSVGFATVDGLRNAAWLAGR